MEGVGRFGVKGARFSGDLGQVASPLWVLVSPRCLAHVGILCTSLVKSLLSRERRPNLRTLILLRKHRGPVIILSHASSFPLFPSCYLLPSTFP